MTAEWGVMNEEMKESNSAHEGVHRSVTSLASKLAGTRSLRDGDVVLRLAGKGAATYVLSSRNGRVEFADVAGPESPPLVEVMGDAEQLRSILDGEADAREQFLAGGIRVRGDLRYLSDAALELGLLKDPL
jgi:hypothetical protein